MTFKVCALFSDKETPLFDGFQIIALQIQSTLFLTYLLILAVIVFVEQIVLPWGYTEMMQSP